MMFQTGALATGALAALLLVAVSQDASITSALISDDECLATKADALQCTLSALQRQGHQHQNHEAISAGTIVEAGQQPRHDKVPSMAPVVLGQPDPTPPKFPLRTSGRFIVRSDGRRVKFACVNWSGGDQKDGVVGGLQKRRASDIAITFKRMGFNCVRLPWSVWMVQTNPVVTSEQLLAANQDLKGRTTLEIFDAVISALAAAEVMVVLDNHNSDGIWCCSVTDENGMWWNYRWSESAWMDAHTKLAGRYRTQPWVVASELRNEVRSSLVGSASWGMGSMFDWHAAATRAGNAILHRNPDLLIIVAGLHFNTDLSAVRSAPVRLDVHNRVVYAAHCYSWSLTPAPADFAQMKTAFDSLWGYIATPGHPYTAPVFVTEFGDYSDGRNMQSSWWPDFLRYLSEGDFDWAVWRGDGTESRSRKDINVPTEFGVLAPDWERPAAQGELLRSLQTVQHAAQGPGVQDRGCAHCADAWEPGWANGRRDTSACWACLVSKACRKDADMEPWCTRGLGQSVCSQTCCRAGLATCLPHS